MTMQQIVLTIGGNTKRSRFTHEAKVDWEKLPEESRAFIIRYGVKQYLADGTAGAETEAEFKAGVDSRVAKLLAADFTRAKGEGNAKPDTPEGRALKLAKAFLREQIKTANAKALAADAKAEPLKPAPEVIEASAKKMLAANGKWLAEAKAQIEREKALAGEETGEEDIMALLGIEPEA